MRDDHAQALAVVDRELARRGISSVHRSDVAAVARRFLTTVERPAEELGPDDVRRFLAKRRVSVSARTQASELSRLRTFFATLVALGLRAEDPTARLTVKLPASAPHLVVTEASVKALLDAALVLDGQGYMTGAVKKVRPDLSPEGVQAFLVAASKRDRAALELLYGIGLRSAEIRAARVVDLDLAEGSLLVRRAKGGTPERLPLPQASLPHLRAWLDARPLLARGQDEGRFLLGNDGCPLRHATAINKLVKRIAKRTSVAVHPHALRRGVATHLVRGGAPITAVQKILGHASLSTTAIYVEVDREDLRKAVAFLDRPGTPPS